MSIDATRENILALAKQLGVAEADAHAIINFGVEIVCDEDPVHQRLAALIEGLLGRTLSRVLRVNSASETADLILCLDQHPRAFFAPALHVALGDDGIHFAPSGESVAAMRLEFPHAVFAIASCYIAGAVLNRLVPGLSNGVGIPATIPWPDLTGGRRIDTNRVIDVGTVYLVGAGAIGNGFVWGLEGVNLKGHVVIVDDDEITDGNLNRNVLNVRADLGTKKAEVLAGHLQMRQPRLKVSSKVKRLEDLALEEGELFRVPTLVSAVDSRRARRRLQHSYPRVVFDASTTGLSDITLHRHTLGDGGACLACIYPENAKESSREVHIAESLGVSLEEVRSGRISNDAAHRIAGRFNSLVPEQLVGGAYDSLFKELCAASELPAAEGHLDDVLAPFCFVSALAGATLALELVMWFGGNSDQQWDYWRINPWDQPRQALKRVLGPRQACEFCGSPVTQRVMSSMWGVRLGS